MKLIGHTKQQELLDRMREGTSPHALIFAGPEHVGKKRIAKAFFWLLNNPKETWEAFDNTTDTTGRRIREESHPDMFVCGTHEGISAEQAREVRRFVGLSPLELTKKLVLVDNAQTLGTVGFNTLLKTFEEPAGDTILIFITSRHDMLPATITSRAVTIRFSRVPNTVLLTATPKKSRTDIEKELAWIAGRPGLLVRYLNDTQDPLVAVRKKHYSAFNHALNKGGVAVRLTLAEKVAKEEYPELALEAWVLAAREALTTDKAPHAARRLRHIKTAVERLQFTNVNTRLALEHALLATTKPDES